MPNNPQELRDKILRMHKYMDEDAIGGALGLRPETVHDIIDGVADIEIIRIDRRPALLVNSRRTTLNKNSSRYGAPGAGLVVPPWP